MSSGWDYVQKLEEALRQARPYVDHAEVADAADLEARYLVLNAIDKALISAEKKGTDHGR